MDMTVTKIGAVVVAELRSAGYMNSTIGNYEKTIKRLADFVEERGGFYTLSLGAEFASMITSPRIGHFSAQRRFDFGRIVGVFDSYVQSGHVDVSMRTRGGGGRQPATSEFSRLIAAWEADMADRALALATRSAYGRISRSYLVFLEDTGVVSLERADAASILEFLESLLDRWAKSSLFWVVSNFRPFLTFINRGDLIDAVNLTGVKRSHRILPVLSDHDQELVVQACMSKIVSARDSAITLPALTTGLRACDIVALRLIDINWRERTIGIIQQKTHNPLTLPLAVMVTSKLGAYILDERPDSNDDHVFLACVAPHTKLSDHSSIYSVTKETFRKAGVTDIKAGTSVRRYHRVIGIES